MGILEHFGHLSIELAPANNGFIKENQYGPPKIDGFANFGRLHPPSDLYGFPLLIRLFGHSRWSLIGGRQSVFMAHRIITQVVITGTRVLGRAFAEAYKQASASQQHARQGARGGGPGAANNFASSGLTLDEACKILNVKPPQGGKTDIEHVTERFKSLFDRNDPTKGGSFYLQSKVLRARERIELEVRKAQEAAEAEAEAREGWKPKVWKD
uniref:Mitochondrial import inner membrane translocase subunit TIM16 n=1 Tax=Cladonia uncialis subsp. uncialis TaxID=180999 RepID=A0A2K9YE89_CLAUC|nr:putative co-chaperone Pam16 [Cladonia uncialis subsp. uncialis]